MKIMYDYQILVVQRYGGVPKLFFELAKNSIKDNTVQVAVPCIGSMNYYFEKWYKRPAVKGWEKQGKIIIQTINKICSIVFMLFYKPDIIHLTWYDDWVPKWYKGKIIITVHDMINEVASEIGVDWGTKNTKLVLAKKRMLERADKVIAVSESTKQELLRVYPYLSADKIEVIYNGGSINQRESLIEMKIPSKYILYVGVREKYKNFNRFIIAIAPLLIQDDSLFLICAGGGEFSEYEEALLKRLKVYKKVIRMDVEDVQMTTLYRHAELFVYPSVCEGFGIPLIEAMSVGCPVACSSIMCFKEVGKEYVEFFDPHNTESIRSTVDTMLREKKKEADILAAQKYARSYTWKRCYKKHISLYQSILEK